MRQAAQDAAEGSALVADDRDHGKTWLVRRDELCLSLLVAVLEDPSWRYRPDLSESAVLTYLTAQAMAVFPPWMLGRVGSKLRAPHVFPLIKSKCYGDDGRKSCMKQNHSCMRRVFDMSKGPYRKAWLVGARGARAVVRDSAANVELFSLHDLQPHLRAMMQGLVAPPAEQCQRCSCQLAGLSLVAADIDQAYEACGASLVQEAWEATVCRYRAKKRPLQLWCARVRATARVCHQVPSQPVGSPFHLPEFPELLHHIHILLWSWSLDLYLR